MVREPGEGKREREGRKVGRKDRRKEGTLDWF